MSIDTMETLARFIASLFALIGLPVLWYVANTIKRLDDTQRQHGQTLYGEKGDNGLKGDVRRLRDAKHQHAGMIQEHEFRLDDHEKRMVRAESR